MLRTLKQKKRNSYRISFIPIYRSLFATELLTKSIKKQHAKCLRNFKNEGGYWWKWKTAYTVSVKMVNKYGNDSLINFSILLTAELLRMFRLALVLFLSTHGRYRI